MSNTKLRSILALAIVSLLLWGIARAATSRYQALAMLATALTTQKEVAGAASSRYQDRKKAIREECAAERKRLGLDQKTLREKYPTPEEMLCRITRVVPGGTAEVVVKGKFLPGTKFLFDNDKIEVVKEAATASEYRASIKVATSLGLDTASVNAFQPVRCRTVSCLAVYIGGKYEWDFTADNGWRIKLRTIKENLMEGGATTVARAEFYRGAEPKPFEVRDASLRVEENVYYGNMRESEADQPSAQAELAKLGEKMADMNLSEKERERLLAQEKKLIAKMIQENKKMMAPGYAQELQKKQQEFGCDAINFWPKGDGVEGNIDCGAKVGNPDDRGRLKLNGTMKYLGP